MKYFVENQIQNPKNLLSFQTVPEKSKNSKKMFYSPFWSKFEAVQPPKSLSQKKFFGAPFELFCRIFGHLGTVIDILSTAR